MNRFIEKLSTTFQILFIFTIRRGASMPQYQPQSNVTTFQYLSHNVRIVYRIFCSFCVELQLLSIIFRSIVQTKLIAQAKKALKLYSSWEKFKQTKQRKKIKLRIFKIIESLCFIGLRSPVIAFGTLYRMRWNCNTLEEHNTKLRAFDRLSAWASQLDISGLACQLVYEMVGYLKEWLDIWWNSQIFRTSVKYPTIAGPCT